MSRIYANLALVRRQIPLITPHILLKPHCAPPSTAPPDTHFNKVRITFPDHTRFYHPDAMVVCHMNEETDHFQDHPVLIVEVLSDSTRRADLTEKRDAYLTISSLKVLIFVESDEARVLLYRRSMPQGGFAVEDYAGPEAIIPLPEMDTEIPLAELYERVGLEFRGTQD